MQEDIIVDMNDISKSFGAVHALNKAKLRVHKGEIHGIVGQNGAGKSTIIKVLAGILRPDSGKIIIDGKQVSSLTPASVENMGVQFIHQDQLLVPTSTVAESIFLNNEPGFGPFINKRRMCRQASELMRRYFKVNLDPKELIQNLSTAQQKIVQITKALAKDPSVLVLDEPTAALVDNEIDSLFSVLRGLSHRGIGIIYISHYMKEIQDICDVVTVMRNGAHIQDFKTSESTIDQTVGLMLDKNISEMYPRRKVCIGGSMLNIEKISKDGAFSDVSVNLLRGEVVGITGLLGSGVKEIIQCLFGLERPDKGKMMVDGVQVKLRSPADAVKHNIAMLPEDRRVNGVALGMSVRENITLASLFDYSRLGFIHYRKEQVKTDDIIRDISIKTPDGATLVRNLSGGNQQKVAVAKWLSCQSDIFILDDPTVAVDVGAKVEIYNIINELASRGATILLHSSDLTELVEMCDRVLVMYRGRIAGEYKTNEVNADDLLTASSGSNIDMKATASLHMEMN